MIAKTLFRLRKVSAAFVAVLLAGGGAKAETIDFNTLVSTGQVGTPAPVVGFQLTLADGFVPETFSRQCDFSCNTLGNFVDFTLSLTFNGIQYGLLNQYGDRLYEDTTGSLTSTSGSLMWDTSTNTVSLTFGDGIWNATVFSDAFPDACGGSTGCTASGTLDIVGVPEPAAFATFAVGLIALATARRQRLSS